jgi:predicted nucleic acid-binding Zn ribbon protein
MALGVLARRWQDVVGERLARECSPAALDAGVLFVRASSQAWAAQIRFLSGQVRERAEEVVGEGRVAAVQVVVGPV